MSKSSALSRRSFLKTSASGLVAASTVGRAGAALAADPIHFATWSAAVDTVKSHIAGFEAKTGLKVDYSNTPWAQFRETMITKFVGGAPIDTLWVSDSWLPEWAEAGWIKPVDQYKALTAYNDDVDKFCVDSMSYQGKQYGITYYTDFMGFIYNEDMLKKAGLSAPPTTWAEVIDQAKTIKSKGLAEYPLLVPMAQETWLIEFISALVFSHGGRLVDDKGNAVMQEGGAAQALNLLVDAVQKHKVVSPSCVETGELAALKSFSAGQHAFGLIPKYRLRTLNDPKQSQVAGHAKIALMPKGEKGSHATVGWMRFYGMTPRAQADATRAANTVKLMEWFGGKADGEYRFQKLLFKDVGAGFGVKSLFKDPEMRAAYAAYGDVDLIGKQQGLALKKDVVTPWFGEWNDVNGSAWQQAILGKVTPDQALKNSAAKWTSLKKQG
ncbi:MAG: sugar ABC transporter substrate-binding protein [Bradyrhizobiaceae bacterium]|nr:MAG: sugar ABC transporter substrate-binding protein [Bradyrhizobiaceae bacterium]